jgi:hypothetical protein
LWFAVLGKHKRQPQQCSAKPPNGSIFLTNGYTPV